MFARIARVAACTVGLATFVASTPPMAAGDIGRHHSLDSLDVADGLHATLNTTSRTRAHVWCAACRATPPTRRWSRRWTPPPAASWVYEGGIREPWVIRPPWSP